MSFERFSKGFSAVFLFFNCSVVDVRGKMKITSTFPWEQRKDVQHGRQIVWRQSLTVRSRLVVRWIPDRLVGQVESIWAWKGR
jgi:hypothetical protein